MSDKYIRQLRRMALDRNLTAKVAEKLLRAHANDWREDQHPRGKGGKFVSKGSGAASGSGETQSSGSISGAGRGNWGHGGRKGGGSVKSGTSGRVSGNAGKSLSGETFSGKNYSLKALGLSSNHKIDKAHPGKTWSATGGKTAAFPKGSGTTNISETDVRNGLHTINKHLTADGHLTPERAKLHEQIVTDLFKDKKPVPPGMQKTFYFLGGGSASGKSSFTNERSSKYGMPDAKSVAVIDADVIKNSLPEYNWDEKTKTGTGTTDRNKAASFAHEESSALAKRAMQAAFDNGYNCTLDGTGDGSAEGVIKKIQKARKAGYRVEGKYCTKDIESAIQANLARAEKTGRMVQLDSVIDIHKKVSEIFPLVAKEFDHIELYDHNGPEPILIASCDRGGEIVKHDEAAYQRFLDKAKYNG